MMLMNPKFLLTATTLVMGLTATSMSAAAGKDDHGGYHARHAKNHIVVKHTGAYGDIQDRTDVRQARQAKRIQQGIRSGALTPAEVARLRQQQEYIRKLERDAERDGHISFGERRRIEAAQNAASRSIFAEKHDFQKRDGHHGPRGRRWFWSR